ncbi:dual specificity protein phosphatase family protein [Marinomonas sp. GJ51-6]|uniref:dual specificity protein phosphatase family protein n=1 Tax=Marinomonas sp. GJ51-6 TaxID=2992802 RepID=UPI0029346C53|nr:dual specificity protein phosphatase family protein [Marinomonas sp. GJ51-6]WOD06520.1 dual specificity protein phosphatase family protein [Marinomonas sp. GJ51-6]
MEALYFFLALAVILIGKYIYDFHLNYNLRTITDGKFYSSGVIPPHKIESYVEKYNFKTIIDFRHPTMFCKLNPVRASDIDAEEAAIAKLDGVQHIRLPSKQVPSQENLDAFFKILDNEDAYPVLVHCYHGTGRAQIYSALYRIEYENMPNEKARRGTRLLIKGSSFDNGKSKGEFLKNYTPRKIYADQAQQIA